MPKVLVVDERADVKVLIGEALERKRVEVLSATSGAEAMERIERERPDVVICDVYMPDVDGYRICDFVKGHSQLEGTPVLLMADNVDRTTLARAARAGCDDVLRKPWTADEIVSRIEALLSRHAVDEVSFDGAVLSGEGSDPVEILPVLAELPGVAFVALADREGFLVDWAGAAEVDPEVVAAVTSCLADSSAGIGRELGHGMLQGVIFQYEEAVVLVECMGEDSRLAVVLRDFAALQAVRQCLKHAMPAAVAAPALPYR